MNFKVEDEDETSLGKLILIPILILVLVFGIGYSLWNLIPEYKTEYHPSVTVLDKERNRHGHSQSYFVTFRLENDTQETFCVTEEQYWSVKAGQKCSITLGGRFSLNDVVSFNPSPASVDHPELNKHD